MPTLTKAQKRRTLHIFHELGGTGYIDAAEAFHIALTYGVSYSRANLKYRSKTSDREARAIDLATFIATNTK